jgi:hypothetical protein
MKVTDQDETSGFIVESSDLPAVTETVQDEVEDEQASSDNTDTDTDENADADADGSESESTDADSDNGDKDDVPVDDASADQKAKKPNKVQERINEVIRQREDEKRESESLRKRIKELENKKPDNQEKEPVESDFENYDQYLDALDKFDSSKDSDKPNEDNKPKDKDDDKDSGQLTDNQRTAMEVIKESVQNDEDKPADFDTIALGPDVPITGEMLEALAECDNPTKVMYHLGMNKKFAEGIAGKSPVQQMREIAKLDLGVAVTKPKPVKTTTAADPISPVKGSEVQKKSMSKMSFSEFENDDRERNKSKKSTW